MGQYILKRVLMIIPLVIGASLITFFIIYLTPGDPVKVMLGDKAVDEELVEQLREQLGLNDPPWVQYGRFLYNLVQGDLGRSIRTNQPVLSELGKRLPATLELTVAGLIIALSIGVFSGVISALKQYTMFDYGAMLLALMGVSIPVFWLALMLSYMFSVHWTWFPLNDRLSVGMEIEPFTHLYLIDSLLHGRLDVFLDAVSHLVLPALTLGLIASALIARMTRSSVLEVMNEDYIRTARSKGLSFGRVLIHILRNALIPVITIVGLQFGALLGGAIITETIFSWPGVGTYLIQAIRFRDIISVQGAVMMITLCFILVNLLVDLLYAVVDPRICYE